MKRRPDPEAFVDDDGVPCIVDHRGVWTEEEWVRDANARIARNARRAARLALVGVVLSAVAVAVGVVGLVVA